MNTMTKQNEQLSSLLDGELSDEQVDAVLHRMKAQGGHAFQATWDIYQQIGDVLRSDQLATPLSADFSSKFSVLLDAEPVILAPRAHRTSTVHNTDQVNHVAGTISNVHAKPLIARYVAMTSMAAAVIVAFVMTPQIIPMLDTSGSVNSPMVKVEPQDFSITPVVNVQMAANSNATVTTGIDSQGKEIEFAPKLKNQVEMLRDPRLDSYLMAHQKASPSLDNTGRYVTHANVIKPTSPALEK
jgi:sigma-E factor negative regulatory protein RseA